jgi:hypothetical protein
LEDGEEKTYGLKQMQDTIAAAAALEKMGAAADEAAQALANMDEGTKEFLGSGSLENLNKKEFEEYRKQFGKGEVDRDTAKEFLKQQGLSEE